MYYAKDRDGQFVRCPDGHLLTATSIATLSKVLKNMGYDAVDGEKGFADIHEFETEDLLKLRDYVTHLRAYMLSPKFQGPGEDYVNVKDVLHRLDGF